MNKKYKPKKPIVYDIDRSLLHSASETLLFAKGKDTIIGQPRCDTKKVQIGTKRVQVGTKRVQTGTKRVSIKTVLEKKVAYIYQSGNQVIIQPKVDGIYIVHTEKRKGQSNATTTRYLVQKNSTTVVKNISGANNTTFTTYTHTITLDNDTLLTINGWPTKVTDQWLDHVLTTYKDQPVYENQPIYEDQPVYKTEVDRGLIMYLRRKGA